MVSSEVWKASFAGFGIGFVHGLHVALDEFLQEGGVVIRNSATTDISAGIWVNGVKFVPTVSGNNLIWTQQ